MRAGVKDTSLRQRFEFGTQMRQRIRLGYGLKGPRVERSRWRDLLPPLQGGKKVIVPFGSRPHKDDGKQHRRVGRGTRPTLGPHPPPHPTTTWLWPACPDSSPIALSSPHPPFVPFVRSWFNPPLMLNHEVHQRHESAPHIPGPSRGPKPGGPTDDSPARKRWGPSPR